MLSKRKNSKYIINIKFSLKINSKENNRILASIKILLCVHLIIYNY